LSEGEGGGGVEGGVEDRDDDEEGEKEEEKEKGEEVLFRAECSSREEEVEGG
jgi:hypothetical protein